ncbi:hypothetical protein N9231_05245 [Saprospiraceae bacterium]|nr:hypothetical protein [Saprospiraceae bacterium]
MKQHSQALFTCFFLFVSFSLFAQQTPNSSPKSVEEEVAYYKELNKDLKGIKGSGNKPDERYLNTIQNNQFQGKTTNHTRRIMNAFTEYKANNDNKAESSKFGADWEFYGASSHTWVSPFIEVIDYPWYGTPIPIYRKSGGWSSGVGRINCIEFHPTNSNTIFVGTAYGGIWKSTDSGSNWTNINNNLPNISISDIAIDEDNPNTIYLVTGDFDGKDQPSVGILKSTNGGSTWNPTDLSFTQDEVVYCGDIKLNPNDPTEIYVGCSDGLFYSDNSGSTFTKFLYDYINDIEFHPTDTDSIYVSTQCKISRYTTSNNSNHVLNTYNCSGPQYNRIELAVTKYFPDVVAAVSSRIRDLADNPDRSFDELIWSIDSGENFETRTTAPNMMNGSLTGAGGGGQGEYDMDVEFEPTDTSVIYIAGVNLWKSTDSGNNFDIQAHWDRSETSIPYVHADIHDIAFNGSESKPYIACDGGIYVRHATNTAVYYDLTSDMGINQFYDIDIIEQDPDRIITAAQDNGVNYMDSPGNMNQVRGADGMAVMYDHNNLNKYYSCKQYGGLEVTLDNGINWDYIKPQGAGNEPFIVDYVMHPTDSNIIFGAIDNLARTLDGGATSWDIFNVPGNIKVLSAIEIGKNDPNILYVAEGTQIWRVDSCLATSPTLTNVTSDLPSFNDGHRITSIAVNPNNVMEVYITMSGYSASNKVFRSGNGGVNWINVSTGLPNIPIYKLLYEDGSDQLLYVGTALGVYFSEANSAWSSFNTGLPPVQVNDLEINYNTREMYAGTFGRGIYRRDLMTIACPDTINLTSANDPDPLGNTMTQTYDSNHTINSTRQVDGANANVSYNAESRIRLKPGFKATSNSKFKAVLKVCN